MSTLTHEVWANTTTPLFLQAGASANNLAPFVLNSTPTPSTRSTTIYSTPTDGGGIYYGVKGSPQNQAYGDLQFGNGGGWSLLTNGVPQIYGYSSNIGANVPITITSPQSSSSVQLTSTSIGIPSTPSSTITFTSNQIVLGQNIVAQDGSGLSVTNTSDTKAGTLEPTDVLFSTNTLTPSTTTYTFAAESISSPPGYFSNSNVEGFIISSDRPPFASGGATYTNPSVSPVGVSSLGTPPSSGKAIFTGTTAGLSYTGNSYLEFPVITAPVGSTISVQWKQVGTYTFGALFKNDVKYADLISYSSLSWVSTSAYTFTSTGDDRLYIALNNNTAPDAGTPIWFNISDIAITKYTAGVSLDGLVGMNGSTIQMSNAVSGAKVEARSSDGAVALYSSTGTGSSIVAATNITLTSPIVNFSSNLTFSSGGNLTFGTSPSSMILNGGSNQYFILANGTSAIQMTAGTLYFTGTGANFQSTDINMNLSSLNMNDNAIRSASTIVASNVDANGSSLAIGSSSPSNSVVLANVSNIAGTPAVGGGTGFIMTNCKTFNQSPACPPVVALYSINVSGFKQATLTILPKPSFSLRNNSVFGTNFTGDSFAAMNGFIIAPFSVMSYSNIASGITTSYSNSGSSPFYYTDTGFSPSSTTQAYSLTPILA